MRDGMAGESKIVSSLAFVERSNFENFSSPTNRLNPPWLGTGRLLHPDNTAQAAKSSAMKAIFLVMFFMIISMSNAQTGRRAILCFRDKQDKPCCARSPTRGGHFPVCKCAARFQLLCRSRSEE